MPPDHPAEVKLDRAEFLAVARQVWQHLGLLDDRFVALLDQEACLVRMAELQAASPVSSGWQIAYGVTCEILYERLKGPPGGLQELTSEWLRSYLIDWFQARLKDRTGPVEDLTGEVMAATLANLAGVRFATAFMAWVERIALNRFNRYLEQKKKYQVQVAPQMKRPGEPPDEENGLNQLADPGIGADPERSVLNLELRRQLIDCLKTIRTDTRRGQFYHRIVIGFYFWGESLDDLYEVLKPLKPLITKQEISNMKNEALRRMRRNCPGLVISDRPVTR